MNLKSSFYSITLVSILLIFVSPPALKAQGALCPPSGCSWFTPVPRLSVGYMFPAGPTTLKKDIKSTNENHLKKLTQSYNLEGLWTEFAFPFRTPWPLGFEICGAYLFSSNNRSEETYTTVGNVAGSRSWRTSTQMWYFQMLATYQITSSLSGILGFRYDSFMTKFSEPEDMSGDTSLPSQTADLSVTLDVPFIGMAYSRRFMYGSTINAGIIGLPTLPGDLYYRGVGRSSDNKAFLMSKELNSGYFLESWTGLLLPLTPWIQVGGFLKYSGVYGKTLGILSDSNKSQYETEATFDRDNWIVAGFVSASF
ncbi:MAG: hypothetical protein V1897_14520 [Pseudomonadota bacterium]